MKDYLLLFLFDVVLGFIPQAIGYAICLFAVANKKLRSKEFLITSAIYAVIQVVIRMAYNYGIIDFGFHSVIIWMLFIVVAIFYNKAHAVRSAVSIFVSGLLITVAEVINAAALILILGEASFNEIMNNTAAMSGKIIKAACGAPTNLLFLAIVLLVYYFMNKRRTKLAAAKASAEESDAQE